MVNSSEMNLGEKLKDWRKSRNLRIVDVAKLLGLTNGRISEMENNKADPTIQTARKYVGISEGALKPDDFI